MPAFHTLGLASFFLYFQECDARTLVLSPPSPPALLALMHHERRAKGPRPARSPQRARRREAAARRRTRGRRARTRRRRTSLPATATASAASAASRGRRLVSSTGRLFDGCGE